MVGLQGTKVPSFLSVGYTDFDPGLSLFKDSSFLQAGFRQENVWVSGLIDWAYKSEIDKIQPLDPNYTPFEDSQIIGTEYERYWDAFVGSRSAAETAIRIAKLRQEMKDRRQLQEGGMTGFISQLAGGLVDPLNVVPFFPVLGLSRIPATAVKGAQTVNASRAALAGNRAVLGSVDAAIGATVAEALLHPTQELRTFEESVGAISAATIFGGILGGVVGAFERATPETRANIDIPSFNSSPHIVIHDTTAGGFENTMRGTPIGGAGEFTQPAVGDITRVASPFRTTVDDSGEGLNPFINASQSVLDNYTMAYRMAGDDGQQFWDTILTPTAQQEVRIRASKAKSPVVIDDSQISAVEKTVLNDYKPIYKGLDETAKAQVNEVIPQRYKEFLDQPTKQPVTPTVTRTIPEGQEQNFIDGAKEKLNQMRMEGISEEEIIRMANDLIDEYPELHSFREELLGDMARKPETLRSLGEQRRNLQKEMQESIGRRVNRTPEEIQQLDLELKEIEGRIEEVTGQLESVFEREFSQPIELDIEQIKETNKRDRSQLADKGFWNEFSNETTQWHEISWERINNDPVLTSAIRKSDGISTVFESMEDKTGYHSPLDNKIAMKDFEENDLVEKTLHQGTFRHEYGHHLDSVISKRFNKMGIGTPGPYISQIFWRQAESDLAPLINVSDSVRAERNQFLSGIASRAQTFIDNKQSIKIDDLAKENFPSEIPFTFDELKEIASSQSFRVFDLQIRQGGSSKQLNTLALGLAIRDFDLKLFSRSLENFKRHYWEDYFGSLSNNKLAKGHSEEYYSKTSNASSFTEDSQITTRNQMIETFANYIEIRGFSELQYRLLKHFSPNLTNAYDTLIAKYVGGDYDV